MGLGFPIMYCIFGWTPIRITGKMRFERKEPPIMKIITAAKKVPIKDSTLDWLVCCAVTFLCIGFCWSLGFRAYVRSEYWVFTLSEVLNIAFSFSSSVSRKFLARVWRSYLVIIPQRWFDSTTANPFILCRNIFLSASFTSAA